MEPDFSGWATKANLKCSDGRTIMPGAFKHMDGQQVPLVFQHGHRDINSVLGYAILKHLPEGVRADGYFNSTPAGKNAKLQVEHGDLKHLSIFANGLQQNGNNVTHGDIREVSLVLAGANPGAKIDNVNIRHSDGSTYELDDEVVIYTGEELLHAGDSTPSDGPSPQEIYDTLTPEQQELVNMLVENALEVGKESDAEGDNDADAEDVAEAAAQHSEDNSGEGDLSHQEGDNPVTRLGNVFDQSDKVQDPTQGKHVIQHSEVQGFFEDAKKLGSFDAALEKYALAHAVEPIDVLFPNYQNLDRTPQYLTRRMEWVDGVLSACSKTPFSNIRSIIADITMDEARAKGYIKGNFKKEEWFSVSKRTTSATTVYKKQKLERDDVIDITDFDVVAWIKSEMFVMLKEEIARAILVSDGRDVSDQDKILDPAGASSGPGIRSIINEHDIYKTDVHVNVGDTGSSMLEVADAIMASMRFYKGTGSPVMYTTWPVLTSFLQVKDGFNRRMWDNASDLASYLGVSEIVKVEAMETTANLFAIIVNLSDYNLGTNKGGEITNFDFFDIDYNAYKYLTETRVSGALTKPKSAIVVWSTGSSDVLVTPSTPTFNKSTGVVTIPTVTGVVYKNDDTGATLTAGAQTALTADQTLNVQAHAASGYYFASDPQQWSFHMPAA